MTAEVFMPIGSLVGDAVVRISPTAPVSELAQLLTDKSVGLAVVGDGNDVTGVVSERDVVRAMARGMEPDSAVLSITETRVSWCDSSASPVEAASKMMEHYVRHMLVADRGRLLGVLSARDLLGYFVAVEGSVNDAE